MLLYLLQVKHTTYKELTEHFEISKQTAIRDINALSSMGVPVYTQSGCHGGIYIPESYKMEKSFFSPDEIESLVFALHLSASIHVAENERSILKKLEMLTPDLVFYKEECYREHVKVRLLKSPISTNPNVWKVIDQALYEARWLSLEMNHLTYYVQPLHYIICQKGLLLHCKNAQGELDFPVCDISCCAVGEFSTKK